VIGNINSEMLAGYQTNIYPGQSLREEKPSKKQSWFLEDDPNEPKHLSSSMAL